MRKLLRDFSRYFQFSKKISEKSTSRAQFERYVYDLLTNVVPELKTVQKSYHMTTFWPLWNFQSKTRRDRDAAICKYYEQRTGSEGTPTHRDSLGRVSEKRFFLPSVALGGFLSSYRNRLLCKSWWGEWESTAERVSFRGFNTVRGVVLNRSLTRRMRHFTEKLQKTKYTGI